MTESTISSTELTSQYLAQVTGDLERNVKEQERISDEISTLQAELAGLKHDHTVLVNMQQTLGSPTPPSKPAADAAAVPAPRKKSPAAKQKRAQAGTTAPKKAAAKQPKAQGAAAKASSPTTLVELVRSHLTGQSEPRSAAEVSTALAQAHPERGIKTTVVRTTLEGLVAKGLAQRSKQGSSVFYASPDAAKQSAPSEK